LANSYSTYLWISISLLNTVTYSYNLLFLNNSFSVCLLWYSNSVVNWWFYNNVSLVVVSIYSLFNACNYYLALYIWYNIFLFRLSVSNTLSLSLSANCLYLSFLSSSNYYFNPSLSNSKSAFSPKNDSILSILLCKSLIYYYNSNLSNSYYLTNSYLTLSWSLFNYKLSWIWFSNWT